MIPVRIKSQKGFTLIELLIVIAILGVLAAAVLSAINPIEQINRGRDTGSLSDAEQLLSAVSRFNAAQGYLPWVIAEGGNQPIDPWQIVDMNWKNNDPTTPVPVLSILGPSSTPGGTGELLPAYISRITGGSYNKMTIYKQNSAGSSVYVCYLPQSGSITTKAKKRCDTTADIPADFPTQACNAGGNQKYYYCLP